MNQRMIYQTQETREKILTGAEQLFIDQGFADTQMKDIATHVGIGRNTLYRYYQDKYDLGLAILSKIMGRKSANFFAALDRIEANEFGSIYDGLYCLLDSYIIEEDKPDDRYVAEFDAYYSGARLPGNFAESLKERTSTEHLSRLQRVLQKGQQEGSIRNDIPLDRLAAVIFHSLPAFYYRLLLRETALFGVTETNLPYLPSDFMKIFLDGVRPICE